MPVSVQGLQVGRTVGQVRRPLAMVLLALFIGGAGQAAACPGDDSPAAGGRIVRVTLYRGQALVTREVTVEGAAGVQEIVVPGLPPSIVDGSLYAESANGLEVRAIRFRQSAVGEEPRDEIRTLDQQISAGQSALALLNRKLELAAQKLAWLDQMQGFVAPTAGSDLSRGVLNAEALREMTRFSFEERTRIAEEQVQLEADRQKIGAEVDLLNRKRSELASGAQRTVNEAVLFIEKKADGPRQIELNYLVDNCGWSPSYTIWTPSSGQQTMVDYSAMIQQLTGENWDQVQLTLSTASPALSAQGPSLAPFAVALGGADPQAQSAATYADAAQLAVQFRANRSVQAAGSYELHSKISFDDRINTNWRINSGAMFCQQMELSNPLEVMSSLLAEDDAASAPTLSYRLDAPVSLTSRSDQQMVRICLVNLDSQVAHVATPQLSPYVFREAAILNSSQVDFLAGPVTAYLDGRFVGRAEIPTVAQGETFVVGFGADPQLRTRRELVDRRESVQGGNREIRMEYRIAVENYRQEPVPVRVMDRLPWSSKPGEIRVTLAADAPATSTDSVYLRRERPRNILRWDVEVPPTAAGAEPWSMTYNFTIDHDRNFALVDASSQPSMIDEFRDLERMRMKR